MINWITQWYHRHRLEMFVIALISIMIFFAMLPYTMISIKAGNEGVVWHRFAGGTKIDHAFGEGTTLIWPWDKMTIYNLRLQQISSTYSALSLNGLHISVDVTFRFKPRSDHLPVLHKYIGPDYIDVLLVPKMGSNVRNVISKYEPETLYSLQRNQIEAEILNSIQNDQLESIENVGQLGNGRHLMREYVLFEDVVITNIKLPDTVEEAIEFKEQTKQQALTYEHRLEIERQEKLRKKIEAEGIRDFQNTISNGISDRYLTWKGIEATLKLSESNNSKVVVIGAGDDGLPLILGGDYTGSTPIAPLVEPDERDEQTDNVTSPTNTTKINSENGTNQTSNKPIQ